MRLIKPELFYDPLRPYITTLLIVSIVSCFWMAWNERFSLIRVVPRCGLVGFSQELIVKIINNTDFQITVTKFGFIHGWFKKFRIINVGLINSKKEDSITFFPLTIPPHDAKEIIIRNEWLQWQKNTKKVNGVYIETKTNHTYKGKNGEFNKAVEKWKSRI